MASHTKKLGLVLKNFAVVVVGISQEDPILVWREQGGKLEMSPEGLQGDDRVAGLGRAAREPGAESEASICARVVQR